MKQARVGGHAAAWILACVFWFGSAAPAHADDAFKVPAGVERALAKAAAPNQTLGPSGRLPTGSSIGDYGYSIAVSDQYAVIGSPADTVGFGTNQNGSVYVYQRVNSATTPWKFLTRLVPGTSTAERFGQSVAIAGDLIVVGAPGVKGATGTGRALLYGRNPSRDLNAPPFVVLDSTITASQAGINNAGAAFGESVGVTVQKFYSFFTGTTSTTTHVFVGAPQADTIDPADGATVRRTGAVVVFRCSVQKSSTLFPPVYNCVTGGSTGKTLLPKRHAAGVDFGQSLSVVAPQPKFFTTSSTITLAVGAPDQCSNNDLCLLFAIPPNQPPPPTLAGVAYVFYGSGASWGTATSIFPGLGAQTGDDFGDALSFNGTQLAVGAPRDNASSGSVRIYEKTQTTACGAPQQSPCAWGIKQTLLPRTATDPMRFGQRVSFFGNQLAVGAPNRTIAGNTFQGSAYHYERVNNTLVFREEIARAGVTGDTFYGSAVAVAGGNLLVGERDGPNGGTSPPGRVYSYSLSPGIARNDNPIDGQSVPPQDRFGTTTVVRDGIVLVGVPGAESGALGNVGLVRVMVANPQIRGQYLLAQTIKPPSSEVLSNLRFGHALTLTANGNRIIIGAPGADAVPGDGSVVPVGAVFVYERVAGQTSWLPAVQNGKLVHASPQLNADFGAAIDVDPLGRLLVVGAPLADRNGFADLGAVSVFRDVQPLAGSSATAQGKATFGASDDVAPPAGGALGDKWGSSVATDGNAVVAGAPETGGGGGEDGYVTVIDDTGGSFANTDVIEAPEDAPDAPADEQNFGTAVDIDDGMVAVGAPGTDVSDEAMAAPNVDEGAVYVYPVSQGLAGEGASVEAPSGEPGDKWGTAVASDGGEVAAGGPGVDVPPDEVVAPPGCTDTCVDQGAVSTYQCEVVDTVLVCGYSDTIYGAGAGADEGIGTSVSVDGETIVAGAPDAGTNDEGAVYAAEDQFLTDGVFRDGFE